MKIEFEIINKKTDHPRLWIVEAPFESKHIKEEDAKKMGLFITKGNPTCYFNLPLGDGSVLQIPYPC